MCYIFYTFYKSVTSWFMVVLGTLVHINLLSIRNAIELIAVYTLSDFLVPLRSPLIMMHFRSSHVDTEGFLWVQGHN